MKNGLSAKCQLPGPWDPRSHSRVWMAGLVICSHPGLAVTEEMLSAAFLLAARSEGIDQGRPIPGTIPSPESSVRGYCRS